MAGGWLTGHGVAGLVVSAGLIAGGLALARCTKAEEPPKSPVKSSAPPTSAPPGPGTTEPEYTKVSLDGRAFKLEVALDEEKRFKGLSDRTKIAEDGGMMFVFPSPQRLYFVMRDCPIPIDIIFLDGSGRITAMHKMAAEAPRGPGEGKPGEISHVYENRLKRYSSKYDAQYVIELKGDTLDSLKLKEGQRIEVDEKLKPRAK